MKKNILIICFFISYQFYGQHTIEQNVVETVLKVVFDQYENQSHYFASTIEKNLDWRIGLVKKKKKKEFDNNKLYVRYKNESINLIIESIDKISNRGVFNKIINECDYKYILFEISYMTNDLSYVNFIYKIDINDLKKYNGNNLSLKSKIQDYKLSSSTNTKK